MISKERKIQWNCLLSYPKKNWLIERFGLLNRIMKNTLIGHKFGCLNRKCWLVAYLERSIHYSGETDKACKIPTYLLKIAMSASKQLIAWNVYNAVAVCGSLWFLWCYMHLWCLREREIEKEGEGGRGERIRNRESSDGWGVGWAPLGHLHWRRKYFEKRRNCVVT